MRLPSDVSRVLSPRQLARIAGVLYLLIFIVCPSGASAATPLNIAATMVCDTGVALIFYVLFRPVNRDLRMLGAAGRQAGRLGYA